MPYCAALDKQVNIDIKGSWRPCCRFSDDRSHPTENINLKEYKDSFYFQDIKMSMEDGWHDGCKKCKEEESIGVSSYRQRMNKILKDDNYYLDISLSNECNLTCRMCSADYSTAWNRLLNANPNLKQFHTISNRKPNRIQSIVKDIDISKVTHLKYLGGEPFITPEINDIFECFKDHLHKITFIVATNCTYFPKRYINFLSKFKSIDLCLSLEGIGEINEYIREGNQWETILKTFEQWKQLSNIDFYIISTVQAYNIHDISNIHYFAKENNINLKLHKLNKPEYLSLNVLPEDYLRSIEDNHNRTWISTTNFDPILFEKFKKFTLIMDKATGKSIEKTIPKLFYFFKRSVDIILK
jgi:molybdenum cofactor biosynthesis enzyme MoaA